MKALFIIIIAAITFASCGQPTTANVKAKPTKWEVYKDDTITILFFRDFAKADSIILNTFDADSIKRVK